MIPKLEIYLMPIIHKNSPDKWNICQIEKEKYVSLKNEICKKFEYVDHANHC